MNKDNRHFTEWLLGIMTLVVYAGCVKDGDESVTLEHPENPRELIIKPWVIEGFHDGCNNTPSSINSWSQWKIGTILDFHYGGYNGADGYYTESTDSYQRKRPWKLLPLNEKQPYEADISLDNTRFELLQLTPGRWSIRPLNATRAASNCMEIQFVPSDKGGDEQNEKPFNPNEGITTRKAKWVKTIIKSEETNNKPTWTYNLRYNEQGRISNLTALFNNQQAYAIDYMYTSNKVTATLAGLEVTPWIASLNSNNAITSIIFRDNTSSYSYRDDGYLKKITSWKTGNSGWDVEFYKTDMDWLGKYWIGYYSTEANDANIDLNSFITKYSVDTAINIEDWLVFAPFDFYGKRSEHIVDGDKGNLLDDTQFQFLTDVKVTRDTNKQISQIYYVYDTGYGDKSYKRTYTISIIYQDVTISTVNGLTTYIFN